MVKEAFKKKKEIKKDQEKRDIYNDIFDTVKYELELNNIFKEIWELKTCIHVLLSEE